MDTKTVISSTGEFLIHFNVFKLDNVLIRDSELEPKQIVPLLELTILLVKTLSEKTIQQLLNGQALFLTIMVLSSGEIFAKNFLVYSVIFRTRIPTSALANQTPADYAEGFIIFVVYNQKLSGMPAGEGDLRFTMYRKMSTIIHKSEFSFYN